MRIVNDINAPYKWIKHCVLVQWNLRTKENLVNTIIRFKKEDLNELLDEIKDDVIKNPNKYAYIIKLVYRYEYYKLPNIIIRKVEDLLKVKDEMKKYDIDRVEEVWYCKNLVENNRCIFGRVLLQHDDLSPLFSPIKMEFAWNSSARIIERFPLVDSSFVSAKKSSWASNVEYESMLVIDKSKDELINTTEKIFYSLSKNYSKINDFCQYAYSCGCKYVCLEFKYENDMIHFIDWDSDNDSLLLSKQEGIRNE